ncbi:MAG: type I secretion system permease/ATPase, partial [Gammaproteobacteria bacterium]|nr:type I secretion system permease/ATPase [Gammaproteobacteria bacterium]
MSDQNAPPETADDDALLKCLVEFARLFHRPVTADALLAGLPVSPGATIPELFSVDKPKSLFSRVAKRAGFASRLVRRRLEDFSELLLPCILVLKERDACILESIDRAGNRAKVIHPDVSDGESWVSLEVLERQYLGFAFLLKREYRSETPSTNLFEVRSGHWFWGTLARSRRIYAAVIIGSVMVNLFALAAPLFTMNVYDR